MFTQEDNDLIYKEFESLRLASLKRCANKEEYEGVIRAFEFANEAHKGVRRRSGEPYILHPIAVAKIVVQEIGLGYKSIVTALLHDIVEDTEYTVEDIARLFGPPTSMTVSSTMPPVLPATLWSIRFCPPCLPSPPMQPA